MAGRGAAARAAPAIISSAGSLAVSTSLTWIRLHQHQVEEDHRHDEIKTVLAHQALSPEVTAIITALRTSTPRPQRSTGTET